MAKESFYPVQYTIKPGKRASGYVFAKNWREAKRKALSKYSSHVEIKVLGRAKNGTGS